MRENNYSGFVEEQKFVLAALEKGFRVARPLFDQEAYDFILDYNGKLSRVQLKSTKKFQSIQNRYSVSVSRRSGELYTKKDTDFIIISVPNRFFIVPVEQITSRSIRIYNKPTRKLSNTKTGIFMVYEEMWDLLK